MSDAWVEELTVTVLCAMHSRLGGKLGAALCLWRRARCADAHCLPRDARFSLAPLPAPDVQCTDLARVHAGRDSPLRALDAEMVRMVVDMVRTKTGVQRWRYIQVRSRGRASGVAARVGVCTGGRQVRHLPCRVAHEQAAASPRPAGVRAGASDRCLRSMAGKRRPIAGGLHIAAALAAWHNRAGVFRPLGAAVLALCMHVSAPASGRKLGVVVVSWKPLAPLEARRVMRTVTGEQLPHNTSCGVNLRPKACPGSAWHSTEADGHLVRDLARLSPTLQYLLPNLCPPAPAASLSPFCVGHWHTKTHRLQPGMRAYAPLWPLLCPPLVSLPPCCPRASRKAAPRN